MEEDTLETKEPERKFELLETVRCLECGSVYSKPAGRGTALGSPGCPECGYVGWVSADAAVNEELTLRRSAAGRQQHL